jgi:hypothetical protein
MTAEHLVENSARILITWFWIERHSELLHDKAVDHAASVIIGIVSFGVMVPFFVVMPAYVF